MAVTRKPVKDKLECKLRVQRPLLPILLPNNQQLPVGMKVDHVERVLRLHHRHGHRVRDRILPQQQTATGSYGEHIAIRVE